MQQEETTIPTTASFYLGYVAAKHPDATLLVVANDKGYDSMLGHAKLLGFTATRMGFKAKAAPAAKKAAAKKVPAKNAAPAAKVGAPAKKFVAKKVAPVKEPAKSAPAVKKVAAKKAPVKTSVAKKQPAPKAVVVPADKVLARAQASLDKMEKNRPTKLASLLRHLKSIVGQGATDGDAEALSHRLEEAKVIQVVGDLVLYL